MTPTHLPAVRGGLLALLAATLFGISTPLVQRAGAGSVALAWGLQRTSGTGASLMLALEALFTALLVRMLYREVMDRRVWTAMLLLFAGGIVLVLDRGLRDGVQLPGLLAVLAATAAWGIDNALSRAVAERDPGQVVLGKSALGAAATAVLALAAHEPVPRWGAVLALLAIALGDRPSSWSMAAGGALMLSRTSATTRGIRRQAPLATRRYRGSRQESIVLMDWAAASRAATASHCTFWKKASMYLAAAAP